MVEAASRPADWVMAAIVGTAGLQPTLAAVRQGTARHSPTRNAWSAAGELFMAEVARHGTRLLPVEFRALGCFQVLAGSDGEAIDKIYLTASGGPFRRWSRDEMARCDAGTGAHSSQLVDGAEDHHRIRRR